MEKEELLQFLKDNLSIDARIKKESYGMGTFLTIKLLIGDEVISETCEMVD